MSDPFDDVTPIGSRPAPVSGPEESREDRRPASLRMSQREQQVRKQRTRSNQHEPVSEHAEVPGAGRDTSKHSPKPRGRIVTLDQLRRMNSDLAVLSYRDAKTTTRLSDRKHASTSLAIHTDKLLLLSNRPTQIHGFVEAETLRQPMRELGLMIATVKRPA